jgi:hypothetical protein
MRPGEIACIEARMLAGGRDMPVEAMEFRLPRGQILGLGFAGEPGEECARTGGAHLQLGQIATPALALAADVVGGGVARVVRAAQRLLGALRFALRALEFAVEMLDRGLERCDMHLQHVGIVAPFVDRKHEYGGGVSAPVHAASADSAAARALLQPRDSSSA